MSTPIPRTIVRPQTSKTVSSHRAWPRRFGSRLDRRTRPQPPFPRKALFEQLEPRLLLSADPVSAAASEFADYSALYEDAQSALSALGVSADMPRVVGLSSAVADTLVATNRDNTWEIVGPDEVLLNGERFTGIANLVGGADNTDTFVLMPGGRLSGALHGGPGGFDSLVIDAGMNAAVVSTVATADSGTVRVDGIAIAYAGLEPITVTGTGANRTLVGTAGADQIRISAGAASGAIDVTSSNGGFESHSFLPPFDTLVIDASAGDDTIRFDLVDVNAALMLDGGAGNDIVDLSQRASATGVIRFGNGSAALIDADTYVLVRNVESFVGAAGTIVESGIPAWLEQGPGPITGGQVQGIPDQPVSGAVQAIAIHPYNASIVFVGTANGGVWRSTDGGQHWHPLTDQFPSLAIGDVSISPIDADGDPVGASTPLHKLVVYAGTGKFSNSNKGGLNLGLLKSSNGGDTWALLAANDLLGLPITSVVPTRLTASGQPVVLVGALDKAVLAIGADGTARFNADGSQKEEIRKEGGILRSVDGGASFTNLSVQFSGGAPEGGVSDLVGDPSNPARYYAGILGQGVWRSDDGGENWSDATNNLPGAKNALRIVLSVSEAIDPVTDKQPIYAALIHDTARLTAPAAANSTTVSVDRIGIFEVGDQVIVAVSDVAASGNFDWADWDQQKAFTVTAVDRAAGTVTLDGTLAEHTAGQLIRLFGSARASGIYRSADLGASWTAMDLPVDADGTLNPGGQAVKNFALLADRSSPNVVYAAGDREAKIGGVTGSVNWTGRIFRGDAGAAAGNQWKPVVANGANKTAPHADSRELIFAPDGSVLVGDDGGIYRLTDPSDPALREWHSMIGNLRVTEVYSLAYDSLNRVFLVGTQDVGTAEQQGKLSLPVDMDGDGIPEDAAARLKWQQITQGDGNTQQVIVDAGHVLRFSMGNSYSTFKVREFDANGGLLAANNVGLRNAAGTAVRSGLDPSDRNAGGFTHIPYAVNAIDNKRMLVGLHSLYESFDRLETLQRLQAKPGNATLSALAYGGYNADGTPNADVTFAARHNKIYVWPDASSPVAERTIAGAGTIVAIALDPDDWRIAYAADARSVYRSDDAGEHWAVVSDRLATSNIESLAVIKTSSGAKALLAGTQQGVFRALNPGAGAVWTEFGRDLPNVLVHDIDYTASGGVLAAGTLGRGVFSVDGNATDLLDDESVLRIVGTAANDTIRLSRSADNASLLDIHLSGAARPEFSVPLSSILRIEVEGLGGSDTLILDSAHGALSLPEGIHFDGGAGTNTLGLQGGQVIEKESQTTGTITTFSSRDTGSKAVQSVSYQNVATFSDNLPEAPTLDALAYAFSEFWQWFDQITQPGEGVETELAVLGNSLPRALAGVPVGQLLPTSTPGPDSPQASGAIRDDVEGFRRIIESGPGGFSLDDIGVSIGSYDELRAALDDLDGIGGNVSYTEVGDDVTFDIEIVKHLSGTADFEAGFSLFGGSVDLGGLIEIGAEVAVKLVLGFDSQGFFIDTTASANELLVRDITLQGQAGAEGRFGFLDVEVGVDALTVDDEVSLAINLDKTAGGGRIRLSDFGASLGGLVAVSLAGSPTEDDISVRASASVKPLIPGFDAPIDLGGAEVTLTWADVAKPLDVSVEASAGLAQDLIDFLHVSAGAFL
ncbi:MAG: LEPR-XLL domain-containing protein, partial [Betaproteobacteria bacterium]